jgi:FtsZ-binding cell division protein ZapB
MHFKPLLLALCLASYSLADSEAEYTSKITQRAVDIVQAVKLEKAETAEKAQQILMQHYRDLRTWHDANDAAVKAALTNEAKAAAKASLKPIHDSFLKALTDAGLTATQVDTVKDKMVYNKVQVTYQAYVEMIPALTEPQKTQIMEWLIAAREEAMDGGSSDEKSAIFGVWKGKIVNYLTKEGYDLKKEEKGWQERRKQAKPAAPSAK